MQQLFDTLLLQARAFSTLEVIAVTTALLYLLLAIRQNICCWICAGISTGIYVSLFFAAKLYMQTLLNLFYFAMAVYGYWVWHSGQGGDEELAVVTWPLSIHSTAIAAIVVAGGVSGYLLSRYTDAEFPYVDSFATWAAIWATFLIARKVLENWWYWLVIDTVMIFVYWSRDLQLTSLLFVVYVIMIPFGLISWARSRRSVLA